MKTYAKSRPRLAESLLIWINALDGEEPIEFRVQEAAMALGRDRQAIDYWLDQWRRQRKHVRKSGSKPGVWVRRPAKGAP